MSVRWMAWALGASAAVGTAMALFGQATSQPPAPSPLEGDRAARVVAEPDRVDERPLPPLEPAPSRRGVVDAEPPEAEIDLEAIEEELRRTHEAIEASRRIAERMGMGDDPAPSAERATAAPSVAIRALCTGAGLACRSSADCCPGLACSGGVGGYGTPGRCEGESAR